MVYAGAEHSVAHLLQYFPPKVNNFVITQGDKQSHDNSIIYFLFYDESACWIISIVYPWSWHHGNYPTLQNKNNKSGLYFLQILGRYNCFTIFNTVAHCGLNTAGGSS